MESKPCTNCGNQIPAAAKFCTSCGATTTPADQPATSAQTAAPTATATAASAPFTQTPVQPHAPSATAATPAQAPVQPHAPSATAATPAQTAAPTTPFTQAPVQPHAPSATAATPHPEEPISTGGHFGILLLLAIPALNLLLLIIWACGGCRKRNKRNLARAILLWCLIGGILTLLIILAGTFLFGNEWNTLKESLIRWSGITK